MKLAAAAVAALLVLIALAGCGASADDSAAPETITINVPASKPARDVVGTVTRGTPQVTGPSSASAPGGAGTSAGAGSAGASSGATAGSGAGEPTVTPLTPAADAQLNGVAVWVPYWSLSTSVATAIDHAGLIKVAHPFMDEIDGGTTVADQSGGQESTVAAQLSAHGITVIPTVTETAKMAAFTHLLADPTARAKLLDNLVGLAETGDNDGVDLDFEDMAYGNGNAQLARRLAALYPTFVAELCARLHQDNRSCEVTVMAKNDGGRLAGDGLDTGIYDYAALAAAADKVQLMAYDDHVPSGAAGPIAPWPWVLSVLDYAMAQVPAEKLVLGIPTYGYEWSSDGDSSSLTAAAAEALAAKVGAQIGWSDGDAEPFFDYSTGPKKHRVSHTVWFEDATANYDRAVLAADDKLAGIDFWAAGDESPQTWTMLARLR